MENARQANAGLSSAYDLGREAKNKKNIIVLCYHMLHCIEYFLAAVVFIHIQLVFFS